MSAAPVGKEYEVLTERLHALTEKITPQHRRDRYAGLLQALLGDQWANHGLTRAFRLHAPDDDGLCTGCAGREIWRLCPVGQVVRAGLAMADSLYL